MSYMNILFYFFIFSSTLILFNFLLKENLKFHEREKKRRICVK